MHEGRAYFCVSPYRSHPLIPPLCLLVRSVGIRDNDEDGFGTFSGRRHFTVIGFFAHGVIGLQRTNIHRAHVVGVTVWRVKQSVNRFALFTCPLALVDIKLARPIQGFHKSGGSVAHFVGDFGVRDSDGTEHCGVPVTARVEGEWFGNQPRSPPVGECTLT